MPAERHLMDAAHQQALGHTLPVLVPKPSTITVLPQLQMTLLDTCALIGLVRSRLRHDGQLTVVFAGLCSNSAPQAQVLFGRAMFALHVSNELMTVAKLDELRVVRIGLKNDGTAAVPKAGDHPVRRVDAAHARGGFDPQVELFNAHAGIVSGLLSTHLGIHYAPSGR
jgi:hypothetical protein